MRPSRRSTWIQLALVLVLLTTFVLAELLRYRDGFRATILSMAGWSSCAVLFLWWLLV